jgi:hypothetical protein
MLRLLLEKAPQHSAGMLQLARVLAEQYQKHAEHLKTFSSSAQKQTKAQQQEHARMLEESCDLYERVVTCTKDVRILFRHHLTTKMRMSRCY